MSGIRRPTCRLGDFHPFFQEMENYSEHRRPPSRGQDELKVWSTNCPPSILPPPLYPGEVVQLKEHRILCVDATTKPLIGAVFVTNYRVIFSGNHVEDQSVQQLVADYQDAQPKPVLPVRTMHRIRNRALPSDSPRESGGNFIRRARLTLKKKAEDSSRCPRPGEARNAASADELDDDEQPPRERSSTGKNLLRSIRRTWQQTSRKKPTAEPLQLAQSGNVQEESEEQQSSESSSTPSSPVSKREEDSKCPDFEQIPEEFLVSDEEEEKESVDGSVPLLTSSDSEEEEEEPALLTKSLAPQISSSAHRLSYGYANFMFFSRSAHQGYRSRPGTVIQKPPLPTPRLKKTTSLKASHTLPMLSTHQENAPVPPPTQPVESYDLDSDSSEDDEKKPLGAVGNESKPPDRYRSVVTVVGGGSNRSLETASSTASSRLQGRPQLSKDDTLKAEEGHWKDSLDTDSTVSSAHPVGTPPNWKVHKVRGTLEKSGTIKAGDTLPSPDITHPQATCDPSLGQQVAPLSGASQQPLLRQGHGELQTVQSRPRRPPPPVPPCKPVVDETKRSYTVGTSTIVERAKASALRNPHLATIRSPSLPPPQPPPRLKKLARKTISGSEARSVSPKSMPTHSEGSTFSDESQVSGNGKRVSNGMIESSAVTEDTDSNDASQSEQPVCSTPAKQPLTAVSEEEQPVLSVHSARQEHCSTSTVSAGILNSDTSNGTVQTSGDVAGKAADTSSPTPAPAEDPRIKELTSYENFLPIAWRKKAGNDDTTDRDTEELENLMVERSYLNRSFRSVKDAVVVDQEKAVDFRKSYTLPSSGSLIRDKIVPHVPVTFETHVWCLRGAVHQVKRVQTNYPIEDCQVQLVPGAGIFISCYNFHSLKLFVHPHNTYDADALKKILEEDMSKSPPPAKRFSVSYRRDVMTNMGSKYPLYVQEERRLKNTFSMTEEAKRLGFDEVPLWTLSNFLEKQPDVSPTYPSEVIVPRPTPLIDLERVAPFFRDSRFPVVTWRNKENGALLFRGAAATGRRGGAGNKIDQSLFQQICGCLEGKDDIKLYFFTEKEAGALPQGYSALSSEQKEAYFYSGVKFVYADHLPTYKNVRRSFIKLMSLLENKDSTSYLSSLEHTGWLHRISDLLAMGCEVCALLSVEAVSVLVAYETGRDITTQIVSLAQLLLDPFYRTMDGFQMLIQKEWLSFSHPFASRHGVNPDRHGEAGPVFLQWIDCVWQVMQQCPSAFEFNELFLETLVDHSYSAMFRTFLVNTHQEAVSTVDQAEGVSFWTWVSICNQTNKDFFNCLYDRDLYPGPMYVHFEAPCLRLWTSYYCKLRAEHNLATHSTQLRMEMELFLHSYEELHRKVSLLERAGDTPDPASLTLSVSLQKGVSTELLESRMCELVTPAASRGGMAEKAARDILVKHRAAKAQRKFGSVVQYLEKKGVDPSISQHVCLKETSCSGYLVKLGGRVRNWKKRWFVVDFSKSYLCYFQDENAFREKTTPKGVINLQDIKDVYQTSKGDHLLKHIFLVETPQRTYQVRAPTLPTLTVWMTLLQMPISSAQQT